MPSPDAPPSHTPPPHAPTSTPRQQLALQFAAVIAVLSLAWPYYGWDASALPWRETSLAIGTTAYLFARFSRQPWWWQIMHGIFMPLAWLTVQWQIDPGWFLLAFILLLLVYRGAISGQVPLYLSNRETVAALADLVVERDIRHFLDLGAGVGSTTLPLARSFPERQFTGVENAPLTWLAGRVRIFGQHNIDWRWGDLWAMPLAECDLVYAFLSPVPMPDLWHKAKSEMRPGSLLISNSFPVPDVTPNRTIEVPSSPPRTLYCYVI